VDADRNAVLKSIVDVSGFGIDDQVKLRQILDISANSYAQRRVKDDLWTVCEGKQVLNDVARATGFAGTPTLVQATFAAWMRNDALIPEELTAFRQYLATL
jgi:hypothetical protein